MSVDLGDWKLWLALAQTLAIVVLWMRKPGETAGEAVIELKARVDVMGERMKHMPTTEQLTVVQGDLKAINARLENLDADVTGTRQTVIRIEDWLRNNK